MNSSTEVEVISVNCIMSQMLLKSYFLKSQGTKVKITLLDLGIKSTLNWKTTSRKSMRHINILYLFIADKVRKIEINILHCSSEKMISDYPTKMLQGPILKGFKSMIMNLSMDTPDTDLH